MAPRGNAAGRTAYAGSDGYIRDDTKRGAVFSRGDPSAESDFPHQLVEHVGSEALVALVRGADDFSVPRASASATVYSATVTAGQVFDAAPTAAGRAQGGAWDRPMTLEVTVGDDGLIERVVSAGDVATMTIEYRDLNVPQVIERPARSVEDRELKPPELTDRPKRGCRVGQRRLRRA